jgi:DNA-binding CsgD family transcriptional regulator
MTSIPLSPREREALYWAAQGLSAQRAALKMKCGLQTVKNHLYTARLKYQATSTAHLVYLVYGPKEGGSDGIAASFENSR